MTTSQRPVNLAETVNMEAAKIELIEEQLNDLLSMVRMNLLYYSYSLKLCAHKIFMWVLFM